MVQKLSVSSWVNQRRTWGGCGVWQWVGGWWEVCVCVFMSRLSTFLIKQSPLQGGTWGVETAWSAQWPLCHYHWRDWCHLQAKGWVDQCVPECVGLRRSTFLDTNEAPLMSTWPDYSSVSGIGCRVSGLPATTGFYCPQTAIWIELKYFISKEKRSYK